MSAVVFTGHPVGISKGSSVSSSELGLTALLAFIGPLLALYANGS